MTPRARVLAHIRRNPGVSCREIAAALDMLAAYVRVELTALKADGVVRVTGNTQGMRYTVRG
jgi:predicted ArsR family transcriptional regulator